MNSIKSPDFEKVDPKIDRPHSMLFQQGVHFVGDKNTDRFRWLIYYFIVFTMPLFYRTKKRAAEQPAENDSKLLFISRDWGINTSMNREIYRSAEEYCDPGKCERLELLRYDKVVETIEAYLDHTPVSHVLFDTRIMLTGGSNFSILEALYNCYRLSRMIKARGIVCICGMTDIITPGQRLFAELITAKGGLVVSWGSVGSHEVPKFRHNRIIGPLFLPISWRTWDEFNNDTSVLPDAPDFSIIGSNYEPRKSFVEKLVPELKKAGVSVYINTKKDLDYVHFLKIYQNSKIGFNTNWVYNQPNRLHFTHRNFEVMFTGCLLFSQDCYGLDLYVQEGKDYVGFTGMEDLLEKTKYYLSHEEESKKIARSGQKIVRELFATQFVWLEIDKALKIFNYKTLPRSKSNEIIKTK